MAPVRMLKNKSFNFQKKQEKAIKMHKQKPMKKSEKEKGKKRRKKDDDHEEGKKKKDEQYDLNILPRRHKQQSHLFQRNRKQVS